MKFDKLTEAEDFVKEPQTRSRTETSSASSRPKAAKMASTTEEKTDSGIWWRCKNDNPTEE